MAKSSGEPANVADIRLAFGAEPAVRLFRFQCGVFKLADGRYITVGVPGMSDVLGWKTTLITADMVGKYVPVFVGIEVKRLGSRTAERRLTLQASFLEEIRRHGGLSGFAFDAEGARQILNRPAGVVEWPG